MANELKFGNKVVFLGGNPLTLPMVASDPGSASNGDMYYNTTSDKVKVYQGGSWVELTTSASGANTALSNLASVAINTSLLPGADNTIHLGSTSFSWMNAYIHALKDGSNVTAIDAYGRALVDGSAANQLTWSASGVALPQLTATTVPYLNASKILTSSAVTPTELGYLSGVTSGIQSQLNSLSSLIQNFEWQESAISIELDSANIVGPSTGDRYLIAGTGVNDFAGHDNDIAEWNGSAWIFTDPTTGMYIGVDDESDGLYVFGGSSWSKKYFEATTASTGLVKVGFDIRLDSSAAGSGLGFSSGVLSVNLEASNPSLQIVSDELGIKFDPAGALSKVAAGTKVNVDDSTIEIATNALQLKAGGITNSHINASAAIALTKLAAVTANRALASDASGFIVASSVTDTELGYLSGVTSAIQTQLGNKASTTLDNLGTTAINANLIPDTTTTRDLGSSSVIWNSLYVNGVFGSHYRTNRNGVARGALRAVIASDAVTRPDGSTLTGSFLRGGDNSGDSFTVFTSNQTAADAVATTSMDFQTGNKTAGTGNSGDFNFVSGTSAGGTRGIMSIAVSSIDMKTSKLRLSESQTSTNYMEEQYYDALALNANVASPTAISSLTFAYASFTGVIVDYMIKEATSGKVRIGKFMVSTDGSVVSASDTFSETAALGAAAGLSLDAAINGANVEIRYNNTHATNACTMRCLVSRIRA